MLCIIRLSLPATYNHHTASEHSFILCTSNPQLLIAFFRNLLLLFANTNQYTGFLKTWASRCVTGFLGHSIFIKSEHILIFLLCFFFIFFQESTGWNNQAKFSTGESSRWWNPKWTAASHVYHQMGRSTQRYRACLCCTHCVSTQLWCTNTRPLFNLLQHLF